MKKNEQPTRSDASKEEQLKSSTALTLQELKKEKAKQEAASEAARILCKVCFREILPKRICRGHGGSGGGGGGSESGSEEKKSQQEENQSLSSPLEKPIDGAVHFDLEFEPDFMTKGNDLDSFQSTEETFDPAIIAELMDKELLIVNLDRESKSITLECTFDSLSPVQKNEFKKFLEAILKECNAFKERHHLSNDCVKVAKDEKGNICDIRITLPTVALYDAFLQQLASNLLPVPSPELRTQSQNQQILNTPTPLSLEPKPSNDKSVIDRKDIASKKIEEKETLKSFNPSPFSTELKLR